MGLRLPLTRSLDPCPRDRIFCPRDLTPAFTLVNKAQIDHFQ